VVLVRALRRGGEFPLALGRHFVGVGLVEVGCKEEELGRYDGDWKAQSSPWT